MSKTFSEDEVRDLLRQECEKAGSAREFGRRKHISCGHVIKSLSGAYYDGIPPKVLAAIGLRRRMSYELDNGR